MSYLQRKPYTGIKGWDKPALARKYGNTRQEVDGLWFDSKKEARYYGELKMRQMCKPPEVLRFDRQKTLRLTVNGQIAATYRIDFVVTLTSGIIELVEVKGFATDSWKLKWRVLEACVSDPHFRKVNGFHPNDDLQLVVVK